MVDRRARKQLGIEESRQNPKEGEMESAELVLAPKRYGRSYPKVC